MNIKGYDAWKLAPPWDDQEDIGEYDGDTCNRWQEPDEDYPKPRKCHGTMVREDGLTECDACGERGEE